MLSPGPTSPRARKILIYVSNYEWGKGNGDDIPINNNESSNVLSGIKVRVNTRHDKAHNTLCQDPSNEAVLRPNPIA